MKIRNILTLFAVSALALGCIKHEPEEAATVLTVSEENTVAASIASTKTVWVTSNAAWTAKVDEVASSWCELERAAGEAGDSPLVVKVSENTSSEERNAGISVTAGKKVVRFTLTQKGKNTILVTSSKVEIGKEGGPVNIEVMSNVDYKVTIKTGSAWIHEASASKAMTSSVISLNIDSYDRVGARNGEVVISGGGVSETVNIYQKGDDPALVLTEKDYVASGDGEIVVIELSSNTTFTCNIPDVDWITRLNTKAMSSYTVYLRVAANNTYEMRSAAVEFCAVGSDKPEVVTITQLQNDAIVVAKNEYAVPFEGETISMRVGHNVDFETSISVDWISQVTTKALTETDLTFVVEPNRYSTSRTGYITFSAGSNLSQRVTVTQFGSGTRMNIEITHSAVQFKCPTLWGNYATGTIWWGDGASQPYQGDLVHSYNASSNRKFKLESDAAEGFDMENLIGVSSIVITVE